MKSKYRILLIAAGLAVAAVLLLWSQAKAVSRLERENKQLRILAAEAHRLSDENQHIPELRVAAAQAQQLRTETRDLHRMRGEIHQLRNGEKKLKQARADNEQLHKLQAAGASSTDPATVPVPFVTQAELADVGQATPDALVQTLFYAMREGDFGRMKECVKVSSSPEPTPDWWLARNLEVITKVVTGRYWWTMPDGLSPEEQKLEIKEFLADFRGFRIVNQQGNSADKAELTLQISTVGDNGGIHDVPLQARLVASEWKLDSRE
jgi:hypothetical protein